MDKIEQEIVETENYGYEGHENPGIGAQTVCLYVLGACVVALVLTLAFSVVR